MEQTLGNVLLHVEIVISEKSISNWRTWWESLSHFSHVSSGATGQHRLVLGLLGQRWALVESPRKAWPSMTHPVSVPRGLFS